jgi:hypothetical protein
MLFRGGPIWFIGPTRNLALSSERDSLLRLPAAGGLSFEHPSPGPRGRTTLSRGERAGRPLLISALSCRARARKLEILVGSRPFPGGEGGERSESGEGDITNCLQAPHFPLITEASYVSLTDPGRGSEPLAGQRRAGGSASAENAYGRPGGCCSPPWPGGRRGFPYISKNTKLLCVMNSMS